jgi:8-oxo-dGTP diphosphatase
MTSSRKYPARPIVGVGAVVKKEDCVLLIQRGKEPGRGNWSIPGGASDVGESLRDATVREIREECGVEIKVGGVVDAFDFIEHDDAGRVQFHYVIVDFVADYVSGMVCASSDVDDARWVHVNDLGRYALLDKTREVIAKALTLRVDD